LEFPKRVTKLTKSTGKNKLEENCSGNDLKPIGIQPQENKYQHTESPQRRTTIAKKWQRNPNYRNNPNGHTDIDQEMKENYGNHPIAKDSGKG
jgi:hypothetical protein